MSSFSKETTWTEVELNAIAELFGGGTPRRTESSYFGNFIDWVTPSDLPPIGDVRTLGSVRTGLSEAGLAHSSAKRIPSGSVLFSSRATIGKIAVANRDFSTNQGFINFVPKHESVDPWFLAHLLHYHLPDIVELAGETTYKEVSRTKLRTFKVKIPPLPEQRRIVARIKELFERVDEIRKLREEALQEAEGVFVSVLKDSEKESAYPLVQLKDILLETRNGKSIRSDGNYENGYVLTLAAVRSIYLNHDARKAVRLDEMTAKKYRVQRGDIFISRSNTMDLVGLSAIVLEGILPNTIYPDLLIKLTPDNSKVYPLYLAFALRFPSVRAEIQKRAKGTSRSMVKISGRELKEISIPLPALEEQKRLTERLDEVVFVSRELQSRLDTKEVAALPGSILRKAFSGDL